MVFFLRGLILESVKLAVNFGVTDVNALVAKRYLDFRSMVPALFFVSP